MLERDVRERVAMWVAWHLPRRVAMWAYIRVAAHATAGLADRTPDEVSVLDALEAWRRPDARA